MTRLDLYLAKLFPRYSRSSLQTFLKSGFVTVDNKTITDPAFLIDPDTPPTVALNLPNRPAPPDRKAFTLYEDSAILVLNKPAGLLSINKGATSFEPALEDYGLIVHRLDRATSGVIILAKTEPVRAFLQKQFQRRKVRKTYLAIVAGAPVAKSATIDLPIARDLKRPTAFRVDPTGKPAQTAYAVLSAFTVGDQTYSLVKLHPVTGRTHQLRVHLAHLGYPIVGDPLYGPPDPPADRLFLHAYTLELIIPKMPNFTTESAVNFTTLSKNRPGRQTSAARVIFTAPIPPEFAKFCRLSIPKLTKKIESAHVF